MADELTFKALRDANVLRLPTFKNSQGEAAHSEKDGSDWNLADWFEALVGEIGEYANFSKKYRRGDISEADFLQYARSELADVMTYLDILAFRIGLRLEEITQLTGFSEMQVAYHSEEKLTDWTRADWLVALQKRAGQYAALSVECQLGHVPEAIFVLNARKCIFDIATCIGRLASCLGIDLGEAIRVKFNEVSDRVGSPVIILHDNRVGSRRKCSIAGTDRCMTKHGFGPCPLCYE